MIFISVSSAMPNAQSSSTLAKYSFTILRQKLSMVQMSAWLINVICFIRCSSYSPFAIISSIFFCSACPIFSFIWAAAAFVNVTTRSSSTDTGSLPSILSPREFLPATISMMRSTRTAVLPDPAAADTRRFPCLVSMTCACWSVHFIPLSVFISFPMPSFLTYLYIKLCSSLRYLFS